jgi:hypothetical protein
MIQIISWIQAKLSDKVHNIWCIHCQGRRTVIRQDVVMAHNPKRLSKRLIGKCTTCLKQTSTFISA